MSLLSRLSQRFGESPQTVAARIIKQGYGSALWRQLPPHAMPAALRLVAEQGLGAHMIHALWALAAPDRLAIIDTHQRLSYAQADAKINQIAHTLRERYQVERGQAVILMLDNRAEYLLCWTALFRLGASPVHASTRSSAKELGYLVEHSQAKVLIVAAPYAQAAQERAAQDPALSLIVAGADAPSLGHPMLEEVIAAAPTHFPARQTRQVRSDNVVYTSGTTGRPKGAVRNLTGFGLKELSRILERLPLMAGERHLIVCPLYHSGAQVFALLMAALGATIHLLPHFDAEQTLRYLSRFAINSIFVGPTMIHRLVSLPEALSQDNPLPALRVMISGAAPFPQALRERAMRRFGAEVIFDFYGATEMGWVTLIGAQELRLKPGSVGRPIAGQRVHILDDQGQALGPGQTGLVYVENEQIMSGYLNNEQATTDAKRGGWLTVEDLGHLDEDGYLYIDGRARDMIISGGVNLYPTEIEEALAMHPNIEEVSVIGVPDPEWGERLVAVVVVQDRTSFTPEELISFARASLSSYKIPRQWELVDELPRNPTGKVVKRQLRERFTDSSQGRS